jgi:Ca2+-binding EF-hand superfamily protein
MHQPAGSVADTHVAITQRERAQLFEHFWRAGALRDGLGVARLLGAIGIVAGTEEASRVLLSETDFTAGTLVTFPQFLAVARHYKARHEAERKVPASLIAFTALGGNEDRSGVVVADRLLDVVKEFQLSINWKSFIQAVDENGDNELQYSEFVQFIGDAANAGGDGAAAPAQGGRPGQQRRSAAADDDDGGVPVAWDPLAELDDAAKLLTSDCLDSWSAGGDDDEDGTTSAGGTGAPAGGGAGGAVAAAAAAADVQGASLAAEPSASEPQLMDVAVADDGGGAGPIGLAGAGAGAGAGTGATVTPAALFEQARRWILQRGDVAAKMRDVSASNVSVGSLFQRQHMMAEQQLAPGLAPPPPPPPPLERRVWRSSSASPGAGNGSPRVRGASVASAAAPGAAPATNSAATLSAAAAAASENAARIAAHEYVRSYNESQSGSAYASARSASPRSRAVSMGASGDAANRNHAASDDCGVVHEAARVTAYARPWDRQAPGPSGKPTPPATARARPPTTTSQLSETAFGTARRFTGDPPLLPLLKPPHGGAGHAAGTGSLGGTVNSGVSLRRRPHFRDGAPTVAAVREHIRRCSGLGAAGASQPAQRGPSTSSAFTTPPSTAASPRRPMTDQRQRWLVVDPFAPPPATSLPDIRR